MATETTAKTIAGRTYQPVTN